MKLQSARLLMVVAEGDLKDWARRGRVCDEPGGTKETDEDLDMWEMGGWGVRDESVLTVLADTTVLRLTQSEESGSGSGCSGFPTVSLEGLELMELMPLVVVSVRSRLLCSLSPPACSAAPCPPRPLSPRPEPPSLASLPSASCSSEPPLVPTKDVSRLTVGLFGIPLPLYTGVKTSPWTEGSVTVLLRLMLPILSSVAVREPDKFLGSLVERSFLLGRERELRKRVRTKRVEARMLVDSEFRLSVLGTEQSSAVSWASTSSGVTGHSVLRLWRTESQPYCFSTSQPCRVLEMTPST
ncbi:hypothetical protein EYF80_003238 [Liparis tanakae]|uniref:Uncharacterized protein n=1 Tax=Liparis tanakae TaxID=230148 RepID=A0A4Z2J9W2_9TELE|nr:hypothetical protein EYF80_003238 [Liparis tanakae]